MLAFLSQEDELMTSRSCAYQRHGTLLGEVDIVLEALQKRNRSRLCKDLQGDINAKHDALCKAALVMLTAALEAYYEDPCANAMATLSSGSETLIGIIIS